VRRPDVYSEGVAVLEQLFASLIQTVEHSRRFLVLRHMILVLPLHYVHLAAQEAHVFFRGVTLQLSRVRSSAVNHQRGFEREAHAALTALQFSSKSMFLLAVFSQVVIIKVQVTALLLKTSKGPRCLCFVTLHVSLEVIMISVSFIAKVAHEHVATHVIAQHCFGRTQFAARCAPDFKICMNIFDVFLEVVGILE
jgi:hypothetical protein